MCDQGRVTRVRKARRVRRVRRKIHQRNLLAELKIINKMIK